MGDLAIKEAAAVLGVSKDTIYRGLDASEFPNAYRVFGRGPWRIPQTDIAEARDRWRQSKSAARGDQSTSSTQRQ